MEQGRTSLKRLEKPWREKLRENCRRLAVQRRQEAISKHRQSMSPGQLQALIHADIHQEVQCEVQKQLGGAGGPAGCEEEPIDIEKLLEDIEAQIMADIDNHLAALQDFEELQLQDQVQQIQQLEAEGVGPDPVGLLCPVCQRCNMVAKHGHLACPQEGYSLNLAAEGLGLEDMRRRLAQVYEEHGLKHCPGRLACHVEPVMGGGDSTLTATCLACSMFAVIL